MRLAQPRGVYIWMAAGSSISGGAALRDTAALGPVLFVCFLGI